MNTMQSRVCATATNKIQSVSGMLSQAIALSGESTQHARRVRARAPTDNTIQPPTDRPDRDDPIGQQHAIHVQRLGEYDTNLC